MMDRKCKHGVLTGEHCSECAVETVTAPNEVPAAVLDYNELLGYCDEDIAKEYLRRRHFRGHHRCSCCERRLDDGTPCAVSKHDTPFPAHVATEAAMQLVAATIDRMLPSGRGFALVVTHTAVGPDGSYATYVSNLMAADVPEVLRTTATFIDEREAARKET